MLASRIDSVEALRIGWVNELVEDKNNFEEACRETNRKSSDYRTNGCLRVKETYSGV